MDDKAWKAAAKDIFLKMEGLENERKSLNDQISSVRTGMHEGLVDDKTSKIDVQKLYRQELHIEGYRKVINGKLKDLKTLFIDLINESGSFDSSQLTLFDVDTVKKEFENQDEDLAENTEEDSEESNDDDDFEFVTVKKESEEPE
jgi:hypothetical protein